MGRRVTLKDVAAEAGVSATAVSQALNGRPARMSDATRERIREVAARMNYVPNHMARSLVTSQSMLLALLIPDIENLFFASLAKAIEDVCSSDGYSLIVANSDDSRETERGLLRTLEARGVDGILLIPARESMEDDTQLREDVERLDCPVVLADRLTGDQWCDAVGADHYQGGRMAARLLVEAGHRRVACVAGDERPGDVKVRFSGFVDELAEHGISLASELNVNGQYRFLGGYEAADGIIDAGATAVFCCNDLMAMGFLSRMRERGLRAPDDCSVVGYDNIAGRFGMPELTTVDQNVPALAEACHAAIMARIAARGRNGKPWLDAPKRELVTPRLVEGGTVGTFTP